MKLVMKKVLNTSLILFSVISIELLSSCSSGSNGNISYKSISIPITTYQQSDIQSKFAIYSSVGGGESTLTEIDTGSYFYVIESSHVGKNIRYTGESITLVYDHGTDPRTGEIAYTYVTYLDLNGNEVIQTNNQVPIVVVPDGVINTNNDPSKNYAIIGMRLNSNVPSRLFLPYPYNQTYMFDAPESKLMFGTFSPSQLNKFGMVNLPQIACQSESNSVVQANCWNDMALQMNYTAKHRGQDIESTYNSIFDSGASSNFQLIPIPDWLESGGTSVVGNTTLKALLPTSIGTLNIPLNTPVGVEATNSNGGNMVNVGNNVFNYYAVFYNQQTGQIGLRSTQ